jgi:hypothetical protein
MNIVIKLDQYDENNIFFCEPIKNNIINEGNFIRIIYSNSLFILNGIYLAFSINSMNIENYYNKYKIIFDTSMYKDMIEQIRKIEENIIQKISIQNKTAKYKIYEQLQNGNIKIFIDAKYDSTQLVNNMILLKISGIWETETNYGVTYKFMKVQ